MKKGAIQVEKLRMDDTGYILTIRMLTLNYKMLCNRRQLFELAQLISKWREKQMVEVNKLNENSNTCNQRMKKNEIPQV